MYINPTKPPQNPASRSNPPNQINIDVSISFVICTLTIYVTKGPGSATPQIAGFDIVFIHFLFEISFHVNII